MQPLLNIALQAAREASQFIVQSYDREKPVDKVEKQPRDFVTWVDQKAESILINEIRRYHPDHQIITEESGVIPAEGEAKSEYTWIIDPLDGTTNFIHKLPQFAISIAILKNGKPEHAVVLDPVKQEEFYASRGGGAFLNAKRIRVSKETKPEAALIATGLPFREDQFARMEEYFATLQKIAKETSGIRRCGAASLDLAWMAAGRFDGFWEYGLKTWDIAAGALIAKEAGALVSDFRGEEAYLQSGDIIAGNPKIFKYLLTSVANKGA